MRFRLTLNTQTSRLLPFNYPYPLSAAIYKIIQKADDAFAAFLHDTSYGKKSRRFKLFTFSDLRTPFIHRGDRMLLTTGKAELTICFYLPPGGCASNDTHRHAGHKGAQVKNFESDEAAREEMERWVEEWKVRGYKGV